MALRSGLEDLGAQIYQLGVNVSYQTGISRWGLSNRGLSNWGLKQLEWEIDWVRVLVIAEFYIHVCLLDYHEPQVSGQTPR